MNEKLIMVPGPTNVPERVMRAMTKPMISHRSSEFRRLYESIAENMRYLFQTEGDIYVLTASGTGGVECVVGNVVNPGDKIIVPVFGLFSERLKEAIVRRGGRPIITQTRWGAAPKADEIKKVVESEEDVKAIAIVYNETSTGVTVRDLPEIGRIADENDMLLIVDAVSILGGDDLPVDKWNIDICVSASQKCLACPPGLALFSISEKAWETIETVQRPFYFDIKTMRRFGERGETPFTPAIPLFYALDEALKMIREEGLKRRFSRHRICSEAFYEAIEALGLKIFPEEPVRSHTVITFRKPEKIDGVTLRSRMNKDYGVVISGGAGRIRDETLRIGCMGIISERETIITVNALENVLKDLGYATENSGVETARRKLRDLE